MQTVLLGSSSGAIVEFVVPEPGEYVMVDHHFANASQGAVGMIAAHDGSATSEQMEHHNIPATAAPTDPVALQGKLNFELKCIASHSIAGGDKVGPDLHQVTMRRKPEWIERWIRNPDAMLQSDAVAKEMLGHYKIPMPNQNATEAEIRGYVAYFKWADEHLQVRGTAQPQAAAPGTAREPGQTASAPAGAAVLDQSVPQHMVH
jgi:nitrite reductase (NO-forming)